MNEMGDVKLSSYLTQLLERHQFVDTPRDDEDMSLNLTHLQIALDSTSLLNACLPLGKEAKVLALHQKEDRELPEELFA